jgi:predicted DNA-binding transcriptional regulator YafY
MLATEFEVSRRTIKRDVEYMKEQMSLPIAYDSKRCGYYYTAPVEKLPHVEVTQREMFSLLFAFKAATQMQATPFQQPLTRAVQKLTAEHGEHEYALADLDRLISFRPFAPEDTKPATLDLLAAADSRTAVEFTYRKVGGNEAMRRRVHPYHVTCIDSQWYLLAFDTRRKALRTFVVSRVRDARTVDENFIRPADFKPADFCAGVSARSAGRRIIRW